MFIEVLTMFIEVLTMFIEVWTKFKTDKGKKSRRQVIGRFDIIPVLSSEDQRIT